ncbi:MAG: helix-turn-helix domain-containing protein [Phenylobacterium sp.]
MIPSSSAARTPHRRELPAEDLVETLTARQIECLSWVQEGKTAWEIGRIMGISARTVESYLAIAYGKLHVRTRVQAVVRARNLGLI